MSLLSVLAEEHALLLRFLGRITQDRPELGETSTLLHGDLLAFFCALRRHEHFEDVVFGGRARAMGAELSADHRRLAALRPEIMTTLRNSLGKPPARLGRLVGNLTAHLRGHFKWEEEHLWPSRGPIQNRTEERARERRARLRLDKLAAAVSGCGVWLTESVGRNSATTPNARRGFYESDRVRLRMVQNSGSAYTGS